ncbi:MAG: hypothetical protein KA010_02825 [Saprospiraceae bacterium]|nr:hypothetical protein [Saprospiraceae bacterium]
MKLFFKYILIFIVSFIVVGRSRAQAPVQPVLIQKAHEVDSLTKLIVDNANKIEFILLNGAYQDKLSGEVELHQDQTFFYCDTAYKNLNDFRAIGKIIIQQGDSLNIFSDSLTYDGDERKAVLYSKVVLENGTQQLFTNRLNYDALNKIATYNDKALMSNGQTQLTSKKGYYYVNENTAFFKDSVIVVDPQFSLKTDTLLFNTKEKIAYFLGPVVIAQNGARIYCEEGFYDTQNSIAQFTKNAQYQKNDQKAVADTIRYDGSNKSVVLSGNALFTENDKIAKADTIRYDEANDITYLIGNANYKDNKQEIAGDAISMDNKSKTFTTNGRSRLSDPPQIIEADTLSYNSNTGIGNVKGNVIWNDTLNRVGIRCQYADYDKSKDYVKASGGRVLLINEFEKDTLFLTCDTLVSTRISEQDSNKLLLAYRDVRILKSDVQGIADSLSYNSTDSLFRMYKNPILWSDTSQFVADTILIKMSNNKIGDINLQHNSLIINSVEKNIYNQIRGRDIHALFTDGQLYRMDVEGNAESIYFIQDEKKALIAPHKAECGKMQLDFGNNKITGIHFYSAFKGLLSPLKQTSPLKLRFDNFRWEIDKKPKSLEDLLKPKMIPNTQ